MSNRVNFGILTLSAKGVSPYKEGVTQLLPCSECEPLADHNRFDRLESIAFEKMTNMIIIVCLYNFLSSHANVAFILFLSVSLCNLSSNMVYNFATHIITIEISTKDEDL
jgi:hypothetical protein